MRNVVSVKGLLGAAAIVLAAFSLLTASGIRYWSIDLFTHFRMQYLIIGLLVLPVMLWFRAWVTCGLLVVSTAVSALLVLPWFAASDAGYAGADTLKVLHANVHASNDDYQRVIDYVIDEDPDLIFIQEVSPQWAIQLHALRNRWRHGHVVARDDNFGIAVFSKHGFQQVGHIDSAPLGYPTIVGALEIGGRSLNLVNTHPMVPMRPDFHAARNQQLMDIAKLVAGFDGSTLLTGDLNSSVWDPSLQDFERSSGLVNARRGYGLLPTWPTFFAPGMIPIDHAYTSPDITIIDIRTGPDIGSDHLPLVVTVGL